MLILSRKINECIVIDGHIVIKILRIDRDTVKLGIQAPPELPVHRQEIFDAIQRREQQSQKNDGNPVGSKSSLGHITRMGDRSSGSGPPGGSNGVPGPK